MSEKFRKIVNAPHIAAGKLVQNIKKTNPEKTAGKIARGAGLGAAGLTQFLLWLTKYVTLDNHITREGEKLFARIKVGKNKKGEDKKFHKFVKKNPNFTSIVSWWMLLATIGGGAQIVLDNVDKDEAEQSDEEFEPGTYGSYFGNVRTITPFLIADLIAKEGVHVDERTGLHTPYLDSRGKWTIGFGSTVLKDGTSVTKNTPGITTEEAYELARWHLEEGETYFGMYCYDVAMNNIDINDVNQALAIGSIMYNSFANLMENPSNINCKERFANLRNLYKEYGRGVTDEMVRDVFKKYPVVDARSFGKAWMDGKSRQDVADKLGNFLAGGRGIYWRRWLEAGLLTGKITPQMLLDCPANGVYEFFKCMGKKKSAFFIADAKGNMHANNKTYDKFKDWLTHPVNERGQSLGRWKKVRDYMPAVALEACDGKVCKLGDKASWRQRLHQKKIERETYVLDYESAYTAAINAYQSGDYNSAAKQLERLVADNPNNALLHNDLAATYNHLGRYDDAIKHAREIVKRIGDKSQYAAAQYNAGFAYEQKGDLQKALANYKLSVANGNRRVQSDVMRVSNMINNRTTSQSKKVVFNEAAGRVRNKIAKTDVVNRTEIAESRA